MAELHAPGHPRASAIPADFFLFIVAALSLSLGD